MFHTLWIGKSLPNFQRMCLSSFIMNGFDLGIYCYDEVKNLPDGIIVKDANEIIDRSMIFERNTVFGNSISQFSDIFRYEMIKKNPKSIWIDADTLCLSSNWEKYINKEYIFISDNPHQYANGILKIENSRVISRILHDANLKKTNPAIVWNELGSEIITKYVNHYRLNKYAMNNSDIYVPGSNSSMLLDPEFTKDILNKIEKDQKIVTVFWNTYMIKYLNLNLNDIPKKSVLDYFYKIYWR